MPGKNQERLFGTDGIRGIAGEFPLDPSTVELIGESLVECLSQKGGRSPAIVIGRDTRISGPGIEEALTRGAGRAGARVASAGVITTPGVAFVAREFGFDAGVVISASHNPYRDNGIKCFSPSGKKLADETERKIEARIGAHRAEMPGPDVVSAGEPYEVAETKSDPVYRQKYMDYLVENIAVGLSFAGMRIGLDCANGAAYDIAPAVFERLGATAEVISASPDGRNINENCGSLHPRNLIDLVLEKNLDLGVAFDGDADRALFIDAEGNLIDGDHLLLVLAGYMKSRGRLS
ncbi:MAG TPA: phosphoglucosamine mutase, partial [Blastocatellia bacterium]|nr:phosphoglucosamine mutase [Blastocatellia bacterium]